jgi:hypothetical protein
VAERRANPVTFVLGGLSIAAGSIVLAGASLIDQARMLLPVGLIAFGIALLVRVGGADGGRPPTSRPAPSTTPKPDTLDDVAPEPTIVDTPGRAAPEPTIVDTSDPTGPEPTAADAPGVSGAAPATTTDGAERPVTVDRAASDDPPRDTSPG